MGDDKKPQVGRRRDWRCKSRSAGARESAPKNRKARPSTRHALIGPGLSSAPALRKLSFAGNQRISKWGHVTRTVRNRQCGVNHLQASGTYSLFALLYPIHSCDHSRWPTPCCFHPSAISFHFFFSFDLTCLGTHLSLTYTLVCFV